MGIGGLIRKVLLVLGDESVVSDSNPLPVEQQGTVTVSGSVTADTELPAAVALDDSTANPTVPGVGAYAMGLNASGTWDRVKHGKVFDLDTGAATENVVGVVLREPGSGGSVQTGTSTKPLFVRDNSLVTSLDIVISELTAIDTKVATEAKQDDILTKLQNINDDLPVDPYETINQGTAGTDPWLVSNQTNAVNLPAGMRSISTTTTQIVQAVQDPGEPNAFAFVRIQNIGQGVLYIGFNSGLNPSTGVYVSAVVYPGGCWWEDGWNSDYTNINIYAAYSEDPDGEFNICYSYGGEFVP